MASEQIKYDFSTPRYIYGSIDILGEIHRFVLMTELTMDITRKIEKKFRVPPRYVDRGVSRHLSELIMRQWGTHIWDRRLESEIDLSEPFFLPVSDLDLEMFYSDLTYRINKGRKTPNDHPILLPDEFGLREFFNKCISTMKNRTPDLSSNVFHLKPVKIGNSTGYRFFLHESEIDKYFNYSQKYREYISKYLTPFLSILHSELELLRKRARVIDLKYVLAGLIRYATLNSGSHQYIVDLEYKERLRQKFGTNFECFGSMFNRYYDNFCSMFPDIEHNFGSSGNFMALKMKSGYYQANPPYEEILMQRMYEKVFDILKEPGPIIYTLNIPERDDYELRKRIENDKLYLLSTKKEELFHVALDRTKKVKIPRYDAYVFANSAAITLWGKDKIGELLREISS